MYGKFFLVLEGLLIVQKIVEIDFLLRNLPGAAHSRLLGIKTDDSYIVLIYLKIDRFDRFIAVGNHQ
jgi:hypothetical protein